MRIPKGSQYMLLSIFFVSVVGVLIKYLSNFSSYEIVLYKSTGALGITLILMAQKRIPLLGKNHGLLLARGLTNSLQIILYFITVQYLPLPMAFTIRQVTPIFTAILGAVIIKEALSLRQVGFFALSFAGIVLINGFELTDTSRYIGVGLFSALIGAFSYIFVSKMKAREDPLVIAAYGYVIAIMISIPHVVQAPTVPQWHEATMLLLISLLGYLAQYYSIRAYQLGPVAMVSAAYYAGVVYTLVFSYLFFGETLPPFKFLGLGMVLGGVLLNIFYGSKQTD